MADQENDLSVEQFKVRLRSVPLKKFKATLKEMGFSFSDAIGRMMETFLEEDEGLRQWMLGRKSGSAEDVMLAFAESLGRRRSEKSEAGTRGGKVKTLKAAEMPDINVIAEDDDA